MGPRRIRRGERRHFPRPPRVRARLQWGHGEFAVENPVNDRRRQTTTDASMGPRRIRRGEQAARGSGDRDAGALQWGHGEFAVENGSFATLSSSRRTVLQWGHGEFAVEN